MKTAALELGEHKITVNCVVPGLIDTPMTHNAMRWTESMKENGRQPSKQPPPEEEVVQAQLPRMPLKVPWLKPEDVAPAGGVPRHGRRAHGLWGQLRRDGRRHARILYNAR